MNWVQQNSKVIESNPEIILMLNKFQKKEINDVITKNLVRKLKNNVCVSDYIMASALVQLRHPIKIENRLFHQLNSGCSIY